jgi:hypothetical protein
LFGRGRNIAISEGDVSCAVDENIACIALSLGAGTDLRLIVEGERVTGCLKGDIASSSDRIGVDSGGYGTTIIECDGLSVKGDVSGVAFS